MTEGVSFCHAAKIFAKMPYSGCFLSGRIVYWTCMRFFCLRCVSPFHSSLSHAAAVFFIRRNGHRLRFCAVPTQPNMEQMLICLSLALIAGLLMSRAAKAFNLPAVTSYLPAVTSYLLAGLLLGPFFLGRLGLSGLGFGFGSLAQVEGYSILTQVALGFIAFVIGSAPSNGWVGRPLLWALRRLSSPRHWWMRR